MVACAAAQYRYYGMDLSGLSLSQAEEIDLKSPDRRRYKNLTGRDCWTPDRTSPRCVVLETDEWAGLVQDLADLQADLEHCRGGSRSGFSNKQ